MARSDVNQEFNTFVGGILTEANPINYPRDFALELDNYVLERKGTLRKRRGLDLENNSPANASNSLLPSSTQPYGHFIWRQAGKNTDGVDILVMYAQNTVDFFRLPTATGSQTNFISSFTLPNGYFTSVSSFRNNLLMGTTRIDYSPGYSTPALQVFTYDGTTVSAPTDVFITVNDFPGKSEAGVSDEDRPSVLTTNHAYNLINQGWNSTNITAFKADSVGSLHPSRSDNMNLGLDSQTGIFTTSWVELSNNINAKVIGGRYPVNIFNPRPDRNAALASQGYGPLTGGIGGNAWGSIVDIAEFNGRSFYLLNTPGTQQWGTATLCFNKANLDDIERYGECTGTNDPTSRDFNQGLDTDGGYIDISLVGVPLRMVPLKSRIVIFSTEGVFELLAREDIIRPSDLSIRKITSDAALFDYKELSFGGLGTLYQNHHITLAGEVIYYMSDAGIIQLTFDANSKQFITRNISADRIQSLVNEIPFKAKAYMSGTYVPSDQTVRWLYATENYTTFDRELIYNEVLNSWYTNTIATGPSRIANSFLMKLPQSSGEEYPVSDNLVYTVRSTKAGVDSNTRFAGYRSTTFKDFFSSDDVGQDYTAVLQTGYLNLGDTQRWKQAGYILPSFNRTEDGFTDDGDGNLTPTNESSCVISAWWDFVDDETAPKVNPPFEAYRYNRLYIPEDASDTFNYQQSVLTTKNRLTGRGRALSLRFESGPGKDCRLLGWGMDLGINRKV
jgi:hypothetical protein